MGSHPCGIAFDGANIWVANHGSNNVSKLRASDGAVLGTYAVGAVPSGIAFDGANIWVANHGSNNVTKLRASDGAVLGTYAVGTSPAGIAFDGANIWVTNSGIILCPGDSPAALLRSRNLQGDGIKGRGGEGQASPPRLFLRVAGEGQGREGSLGMAGGDARPTRQQSTRWAVPTLHGGRDARPTANAGPFICLPEI